MYSVIYTMDVLYRTIEHKYKAILSDIDKKRITYMFGVLDKEKYAKMSTVEAIDKISDVLHKGIVRMNTDRDTKHTKLAPDLDMHELQKKQIGNAFDNDKPNAFIQNTPFIQKIDIKSLFGDTELKSLIEDAYPEASYVTSYVVLDSKYRNKTSTKLYWDYVPGSVPSSGVVSTPKEIRNITRIKLLKPTMPYIPISMGPANRRVGICIEELRGQSYILNESIRAHWIMAIKDSIINGASVCDFTGDDWRNNDFIFDFPITSIDHFTITINNCRDAIDFDPSDTGIGTPNNSGFVTADHGLSGNVVVTVTGFTTTTPDVDAAIIAAINNPSGILMNAHDTIFLDLVDLSINGLSYAPGFTVDIYYEDKRYIIPLCITHEIVK